MKFSQFLFIASVVFASMYYATGRGYGNPYERARQQLSACNSKLGQEINQIKNFAQAVNDKIAARNEAELALAKAKETETGVDEATKALEVAVEAVKQAVSKMSTNANGLSSTYDQCQEKELDFYQILRTTNEEGIDIPDNTTTVPGAPEGETTTLNGTDSGSGNIGGNSFPVFASTLFMIMSCIAMAY